MRSPNTKCHACDAPMYCRPNQMVKQKYWCCSSQCRRVLRPRKQYICLHCNGLFIRDRPNKDYMPKYCSVRCSNFARRGSEYKIGQPYNIVETGVKRRGLVAERDGNRCAECELPPEWNGQPITLQLDHIDGNRRNNDPNNWRLLCPNCHSQTKTFSGRNSIRYSAL